jgi:hypothetical protein
VCCPAEPDLRVLSFMACPLGCFALGLGAVLIDLNGNVGGFLVQVIAEVIQVLLGNGPGDVLFVLSLFAELGQVIFLEELVFIGWTGGCAELEGEADEGDSGSEGGALGGAVEMGLEEVEGGGEEGAEAVGLVVPEGLALAIELGLEKGVVDAPAYDGAAVDMNGVGDLLVGVADEEEVDGELLLGGE